MISGTDTDTTLVVMRQAARVLKSPTASLGDEVRALNELEKAAAMAKAVKLAEMEATRAHEAEGASSVTVWARREIRQDAGATRAQVRSVNTTRTMLQVRQAALGPPVGAAPAVLHLRHHPLRCRSGVHSRN